MDSQPTTELSANLSNIMDRDNIGKAAPVISNSFYVNEVLRNETKIIDLLTEGVDDKVQDRTIDKKNDIDQELTVDERLTKLWSMDIKYPIVDDYGLSRVAQYYLV